MNRSPRSLRAAVTSALTVAALATLGTTQALHTAGAEDDPLGGAARQAVPTHSATDTQERPILHNGSRGQVVVELQQRLTAHGHALTSDGAFGPRTQAAVTAFQTQHGLPVDGIVGPRTWSALLADAPSTKPTAPRPVRYTLMFTKNWKAPLDSRLALLRDGKLVDSYRAGSGTGSTDECLPDKGWLPSGTYKVTGHETNRGKINYNPRFQIQGYALHLEDKDCAPQHGQKAVKRTQTYVHSEMLADGTQAIDVPFKEDDFWRWDDEGDYSSNGCVKLAPGDLKDLFAHLGQAGWPKNLTLQVN